MKFSIIVPNEKCNQRFLVNWINHPTHLNQLEYLQLLRRIFCELYVARSELSWFPKTSLRMGLQRTIDFYCDKQTLKI